MSSKIADLTITKGTGNVLTLATQGKYVNDDKYFNIDVQSGAGTVTIASTDAEIQSDSGSGNISSVIGTKSSTAPSSGYYLKIGASGTGSSSITTAGWLDAGSLGTATATGSFYFPVDTAAVTVSGTNTVTPSASISGTNVTFGDTDTGISITATGGGTATASVNATGTSAGYIPDNTTLDTETIAAQSQTTSATSYLASVTIPAKKKITINTEADSSFDPNDLYMPVINNGANRIISVTNGNHARATVSNQSNNSACDVYNDAASSSAYVYNQGYLEVTNYSDSSISVTQATGSLTVNGYSILSNNDWTTTNVIQSGEYYGKVVVPNTMIIPSGNIQLTTNGSTNVSSYATATVRSVTASITGGGVSGTAIASGTNCVISSTTNKSGVVINTGCTATRGSVSCSASTSGWASGTIKSLSANSYSLTPKTYYINSVTLTTPTSGYRQFSVTVPNGSSTATFTFNIDTSGNVTITES